MGRIKEMTFKQIRKGDPLFRMSDGLVLCNRAGFEISKDCPTNTREQLLHAIHAGWVKPIAYMREEEYTWESLKDG